MGARSLELYHTSFTVLLLTVLLICHCSGARADANLGSWELLMSNAGVSAMHMVLLPSNRVVIFDRTDYGPSNISLPQGACRVDPNDLALHEDCWAHSIEFDIENNAIRPLTVLTDTWCSAGGLDAVGNLVQTGGYNDGARVVRYFQDCLTCDWQEFPDLLAVNRWYTSIHVLPDNRFILVGGRRQHNFEFIPKPAGETFYKLPFLDETEDEVENNLYPFVHLSSDGNLFIFANADSILLNYKTNTVVRRFPTMPGQEAHNYPSSGSSVMLPLDASDKFQAVEIMVCGGAPPKSNLEANNGNFLPASNSCGRIVITDPEPVWIMETMPMPRVMGDMLLLPSGDVLIINGGQRGTAGWGVSREPAFWPVLYKPHNQRSSRFHVLSPSTVPRLYHSTAIVIPDGRVLVGGSNPHIGYNFTDPSFPTELSMEAFSPPYLDPEHCAMRTQITFVSQFSISYGSSFYVQFRLEKQLEVEKVGIHLLAPPFTTHSYSMNQRLLRLSISHVQKLPARYRIHLLAPPTSVVAPAGYYLLFIVHTGIPSSTGSWIRLTD